MEIGIDERVGAPMFGMLETWRGRGLVFGVAVALLAGMFALYLYWAGAQRSGPLKEVRTPGVLTVGVRADAAPFSSADPSLGMVGFEPDLARAIASDVGLAVAFVAVDPASAADFLARGVVDLLILPLPSGALDRDDVKAIPPGYFASGLTVVARKEAAPESWEALAEASVCGLERGQAERVVAGELGAKFIAYADPVTALGALEAERCSAYIGDEVWIRALMTEERRLRFSVPLETIDTIPWFMAARTEDLALAGRVGELLAVWHAKGFVVERARAWSLPDNVYLEHLRELAQVAAEAEAAAAAGDR